MYMGADWEMVNSIVGIYSVTFLPNLGCIQYSPMYGDV